jgi:hypothetical protein
VNEVQWQRVQDYVTAKLGPSGTFSISMEAFLEDCELAYPFFADLGRFMLRDRPSFRYRLSGWRPGAGASDSKDGQQKPEIHFKRVN